MQTAEQACERLAEIAPKAEAIEVRIQDGVEFVDCGGNFESVGCPACGRDIPFDWWTDRMDEDYSNSGFRLDRFHMPCCGSQKSLNELHYDWPQGFSRFSLEAMNPNIGMLDDAFRLEFERILGTKLRIIYRHI